MVGFGVVAAVMTLSSAAFACTVWKGKMTVTVVKTGNGDPNPTAPNNTVQGWGANIGMNHCPTSPWVGTQRVHAGGNGHTSGSIQVAVQTTIGDPNVALTCRSKLSAGTLDVRFINTGFGDFLGTEPAREWHNDCMTGGHRAGFKIGAISVGTDGAGATGELLINKPANHPAGQGEIADLPGTESAVCVSTTNATEGMQVPITVI